MVINMEKAKKLIQDYKECDVAKPFIGQSIREFHKELKEVVKFIEDSF